MKQPPEFDADRMRRLLQKDRFLRWTFDRGGGTELDKLKVLFNSEVIGDTVMERECEKA